MTTTERAGMLAWALCRGDTMTVAEAARLTEQSYSNTYHMLIKLGRKCPIFCDDDHHWKRCEGSC